ncbi:Golgi-associated plant pathogenesis-related protein 1-like [Dermacentor albipictus]|uniref:Golgi-associated plant pathogenesis-related protein 1-like n=1 Tax=Dermacentor albipictus TaxID=60249 RepID=UPI0038FCA5F3
MEYFLEKLRMSRSTKDDETPPPSPYADQERRPSRLLGCQLHYPSPTFIDRVLLARSLKVRRTEGEGVAEFSNSEFVQECLRTHNELRLRHDVPPLRLCSKLCDLAQYWANHLAHTDDFYYRKFRDVGENLFCRWSYVPDFDVTGDQVARYWYSEIRYYDFLLDPSILHVQAGHFSQMVWRSSTTFGVGKARTRSGKIIVVAMYKPAGNVLGEFHNNVLPQPPADEDEESLSPQLSDVAAAASAVAAAAASSPSSSSRSPR